MDAQYTPPESLLPPDHHPGFPCSAGSRLHLADSRPAMSGAMLVAFPSLAALSAGKREEAK